MKLGQNDFLICRWNFLNISLIWSRLKIVDFLLISYLIIFGLGTIFYSYLLFIRSVRKVFRRSPNLHTYLIRGVGVGGLDAGLPNSKKGIFFVWPLDKLCWFFNKKSCGMPQLKLWELYRKIILYNKMAKVWEFWDTPLPLIHLWAHLQWFFIWKWFKDAAPSKARR